jgi:hypothetical protein
VFERVGAYSVMPPDTGMTAPVSDISRREADIGGSDEENRRAMPRKSLEVAGKWLAERLR